MAAWKVRPLAAGEGEQIAGWRYEPPYDTYNVPDDGSPPSAEEGYLAIVDERDRLVAFLVVGAEGRVYGQSEEEGVVDIGVGMRPDLTGCGHGRALAAAVAAHLGSYPRLRIAVLDWNRRSQALARGVGFRETGTIHNPQGTFIVLESG